MLKAAASQRPSRTGPMRRAARMAMTSKRKETWIRKERVGKRCGKKKQWSWIIKEEKEVVKKCNRTDNKQQEDVIIIGKGFFKKNRKGYVGHFICFTYP